MGHWEVGLEREYWINLAQNRDQWQDLVNIVIKPLDFIQVRNSLSS
jgi:hypothetical protein